MTRERTTGRGVGRRQRWQRRPGGLKLALVLAAAASLFVSVAPAATGSPAALQQLPVAAAPSVQLRPGEYLWVPELAPSGPVVIVISLPTQLAHVYRNGVRIGVSTVSTGKPGYETPTGVFTILQKRREHYSNLYANAPMPFMQRLTWDGIALHAGNLPGYPASHGCVRLPYAFSEKLFGVTANGMTVVVADDASHAPTVAFPGWFTPVDPATGQVRGAARADPGDAIATTADAEWHPERAPLGPLTVVLSLADREAVALRDGHQIGRARIGLHGVVVHGTRVYVLLDEATPAAAAARTDARGRRWLEVVSVGGAGSDGIGEAVRDGRLVIPAVFATGIAEALQPGSTVVVTDQPIRDHGIVDLTVIRADGSPEPTPGASGPPPGLR